MSAWSLSEPQDAAAVRQHLRLVARSHGPRMHATGPVGPAHQPTPQVGGTCTGGYPRAVATEWPGQMGTRRYSHQWHSVRVGPLSGRSSVTVTNGLIRRLSSVHRKSPTDASFTGRAWTASVHAQSQPRRLGLPAGGSALGRQRAGGPQRTRRSSPRAAALQARRRGCRSTRR